ncbi:unnamed protein product [Nesidiocoris tenuis]|uniref:Uncharacterized protein n=1 Tax=Nesidiocoris tenuis TaxID=355587 RepID=A0A6H5HMB7_9HEMI|nr:unnamed protein product [Nesidiocoris tenuis]
MDDDAANRDRTSQDLPNSEDIVPLPDEQRQYFCAGSRRENADSMPTSLRPCSKVWKLSIRMREKPTFLVRRATIRNRAALIATGRFTGVTSNFEYLFLSN